MVTETTAGVKTGEIRKGRIWGVFRAIWRVFLEILPLHKSKEKRRKNIRKYKNSLSKTKNKHMFLYFSVVFSVWTPDPFKVFVSYKPDLMAVA